MAFATRILNDLIFYLVALNMHDVAKPSQMFKFQSGSLWVSRHVSLNQRVLWNHHDVISSTLSPIINSKFPSSSFLSLLFNSRSSIKIQIKASNKSFPLFIARTMVFAFPVINTNMHFF